MKYLDQAHTFVLRTMYSTAVCPVILVLIVNREYCSAATSWDKVSNMYYNMTAAVSGNVGHIKPVNNASLVSIGY